MSSPLTKAARQPLEINSTLTFRARMNNSLVYMMGKQKDIGRTHVIYGVNVTKCINAHFIWFWTDKWAD